MLSHPEVNLVRRTPTFGCSPGSGTAPRAAFKHHLAKGYLAVTTERDVLAAATGKNSIAVEPFHKWNLLEKTT